MKRRPRVVLVVLSCLLAGAIVNVAVAWSCSLLIDPFAIGCNPTNAAAAIGRHWDRTGGRIDEGVFWFGASVSQAGAVRLLAASRSAGEFDAAFGDDPRDVLPRWWKHDAWTGRDEAPSQAEARGWPMVSMWHAVKYSDHIGGRGRMKSPGGIELSLPVWRDPMVFGSYDQPRTLPLRVIWTGLAINTLFYAAVLWLILAAPFALRRWRRINRGLCPKCAYPMGTSNVCTECGAAVTPP